jgi:hypothetical protein
VEKIAKRLTGYLGDLSRRFPQAWKQIEELRESKGKSLPNWPDWCFLPIAGTLVVAQNHGLAIGPAIATWPAQLAALGGWRYTKGVYSFDEGIYDALWETPIETIPVEILFQIPEWCLYLETPRRSFMGMPLLGVFVHLEHDANTGRPELRFLFDADQAAGPVLIPGILHLNHPTLDHAIEAAARTTRETGRRFGASETLLDESLKTYQSFREIAGSVISLLLYLCSQNAEIRSARTKRGDRLFEAERLGAWECGWRTGAAIRAALETERRESGEGGERNGPKPHIRRAHWHHFRVGPRTDSRLALRWLPPIPVNTTTPDDLIPTGHQVS